MRLRPLFILVVFALGLSVSAQETETDAIPGVSLIGEYESTFAELAPRHPDILLSVCGDDMDYAYEKWMDMLVDMEEYAQELEYDIRGLKTYLYVFWNADGSIAHLSFYPKPNSRNMAVDELKAFFKNFVKEYQMSIQTENGFSHYASAAFPTFARPEYRVKK